MLAGCPLVALCAENAEHPAQTTAVADSTEGAVAAHGGGGHEGLSPKAMDIKEGVAFNNSMVITWSVTIFLVVFVQMATRRMTLVPAGAQNFLEWLVESLYEFLEGIIGAELVKKTFWFFATIFIFILFTNWAGLFPGVGTIGWGAQTDHGFKISTPFLRGGNADLNMTMAMAMIFFVLWTIWAFQVNGAVGFVKHLFAPKGETTGFLKILMVVVFIAVGFLELVSIGFRPISLSFRLFGNIFAGENMLETMMALVPGLGWILPVPFYFMELLVGIVQAMVFMLLTAVFTMLICQHDEDHPKAHH
jgi:F-type H+-transporting ATPase subunit a